MSENSLAVLYSSAGGIAHIRFNRPERLNAINVEVANQFEEAVGCAIADESVRVVTISAEGRGFVAGGDLTFLREARDRRAAAAKLIDPIHAALKALSDSPKISIGSLKGAVAGAGMSIALNLDLLIAAENTTFNLAYARVATSPDCGGSWALSMLVGFRKALEIALLSESLDAATAEKLGLINRIVPQDTLDEETARLAQRLAAGPAFAQGRIKSLLRRAGERTYNEQLDWEAGSFGDCAVTEDFGEALEAFFTKREPQFTDNG